MRKAWLVVWWALVAGAALAEPAQALRSCIDAPAAVAGASDDAEFAAACEGVRDASGFLARAGIATTARLRIDFVAAMPAGLPDDAVGAYAIEQQRVIMRRRAALPPEWKGLAVTQQLQRSMVAHEAAHAVVRLAPPPQPLPRVAHEYLAWVTMMATMAPEQRLQLLTQHPRDAFEHLSQVSLMVYAFDPVGFGASAWRHWARAADGAALLRRVFEGREIRDFERD